MFAKEFLAEEFSESRRRSHGNVELCCAIIEDTESAHAFEHGPRAALEGMLALPVAPTMLPLASPPLRSELTNLFA